MVPSAYWIDPGNSDCQPRCGRRPGIGRDDAPPECWVPLPELLLELSPLPVDGHSRFKPLTSPPLLALSCELLLSIIACGELSSVWVSRLVAAALLIPAMHRAQPMNR